MEIFWNLTFTSKSHFVSNWTNIRFYDGMRIHFCWVASPMLLTTYTSGQKPIQFNLVMNLSLLLSFVRVTLITTMHVNVDGFITSSLQICSSTEFSLWIFVFNFRVKYSVLLGIVHLHRICRGMFYAMLSVLHKNCNSFARFIFYLKCFMGFAIFLFTVFLVVVVGFAVYG